MLIFQKLHRIKTESPVFKNITLKFSVLKRFNEGSSLGFMKYKMLKQTHFWYMHGICQICIFHREKKKNLTGKLAATSWQKIINQSS